MLSYIRERLCPKKHSLFAEPPPSDLEQPASLVHQQLVYFHMHNFAIQGPKRYADEAPVKTGEICGCINGWV